MPAFAPLAQSVTAAELFPPAQSASLSYTLDPARRVTFRVRVPPGDTPHGVLVFVSPRDDAEPREGWAEVLDRRNLAWIAAEGFGNDKRTSQRVLVALMALKHLQRTVTLDRERLYIGGMSGGGRVASQALSRFPGFFSGALCIVGADYVTPESPLVPEFSTKRVVFMTGGVSIARVQEFLESVPNPKFEKPFDVAELRRLLHRLVSSARA